MATINFSSNTYTGEVLEDLLVATAQGNDTYKEGLIHIEPGIQKQKVLPHINLGNIIQANKPTPSAPAATTPFLSTDSLGAYTISERYLKPADFMVYIEFNPRDFETYWRFAQPQGPLVFRELAPEVQSKMLRLLLDRKDTYINDAIWGSATSNTNQARFKTPSETDSSTGSAVTTYYGDMLGSTNVAGPMSFFDGALARALVNIAANAAAAPTDSQKAEKASGSITLAGNAILKTGSAVESALYAMWQKCPARVRKAKNLKFVMNWETWDLYDQYLTTTYGYKYTENPDSNRKSFKGKPIVVIDGVPGSTIFLGKFSRDMDSCLWMGIDYNADEESVKVERLQANSELYFFQMRLKMDVNLVVPDDIVVYTAYTNA